MDEVVDLLMRLNSVAERERTALKALDTRALFDLAAASESLCRRLSAAVARLSPDELASPAWQKVRETAAQVKALMRSNALVVSRSLEVLRALKPASSSERPALVSQRA